MFKQYPVNFYLRLPLDDLKDYLTPEFKGYLRAFFQVQDLKDVVLEYGASSDVIIYYKGGK